MTYTDKHGTFFGRLDERGNVIIFHESDGCPATRLDASVYPLISIEDYDEEADGEVVRVHSSDFSARNEHAQGITLSRADADRLGIEIVAE